jgi:hypothetical protein
MMNQIDTALLAYMTSLFAANDAFPQEEKLSEGSHSQRKPSSQATASN